MIGKLLNYSDVGDFQNINYEINLTEIPNDKCFINLVTDQGSITGKNVVNK